MTRWSTALVAFVVALLAGVNVYSTIATTSTIKDQRAVICNQATDIHTLTAEIRPVLVPSYKYLHLPASALPAVKPLPTQCRNLSP